MAAALTCGADDSAAAAEVVAPGLSGDEANDRAASAVTSMTGAGDLLHAADRAMRPSDASIAERCADTGF